MEKKIIIAIRAILFAFTCSFISSCSWSENGDEGYFFQDFDNLRAWDKNAQVTSEHSHSGKYAAYTDSTHEFSQTFEVDMASDLSQHYKSVQITAWCMKANEKTSVVLGARIESQGKVLSTESLDFARTLELPNTWINQVLILKFPDNAPADSKIKVFCWSPGKEKSFMDDVKIEFRK